MIESSSHRRRLAEHCSLTSRRLGLDGARLGLAAWLHDVGMTPMAFVARAGVLSPAERERLKAHTELGRSLLADSGFELYDTAAEIAWTHHEHFDGSGYPLGLAGEQIPLPGRIVAVVDAFDSLTSDRPHRRARPVATAAEVLRAERGRQFDPHVLDAFLDGLDEAEATLRRYPDAPASARPDEYVTLQVAAQTLGASSSQLRRWSNEGRITAARTAGGHRRFLLEDVRRLAAEIGALPRLRPIDPPHRALPGTAETLHVFGAQIAGAAAQSIYPSEPYGWLASAKAEPERRTWLGALQAACANGVYAPALTATDALLAMSRTHGTTLLERHAFLERFGQVLVRALGRQGVDQREIPEVRRLIVALQQNALQTYG